MKENTNILISIIVPVYNAEVYLEKCIHSIVSQTYHNIELILINDGSRDNSLKICKRYAAADSRITVIDKINTGVSDTRNAGIEKANGQYVMFVDSDDWLPRNSVELLVTQAIMENADFCFGSVKEISLRNRIIGASGNEKFSLGSEMDCIKLLRTMDWGPWGKLYRTSLLNECSLRFLSNIKSMEDAIFVSEFLSKCKVAGSIHKVVYNYYRLNEVSATHKYFEDYYLWKCIFLEKMALICKTDSGRFQREINRQCLLHCYGTMKYYLNSRSFDSDDQSKVLHAFQKTLRGIEFESMNPEEEVKLNQICQAIQSNNPELIIKMCDNPAESLPGKDAFKKGVVGTKKFVYKFLR